MNVVRRMSNRELRRTYVQDLTAAESHAALREVMHRYGAIVTEGELLVQRMSPEEFAEFRAGLLRERSGRSAGPWFFARYGVLLIPPAMLADSMLSVRVPNKVRFAERVRRRSHS